MNGILPNKHIHAVHFCIERYAVVVHETVPAIFKHPCAADACIFSEVCVGDHCSHTIFPPGQEEVSSCKGVLASDGYTWCGA